MERLPFFTEAGFHKNVLLKGPGEGLVEAAALVVGAAEVFGAVFVCEVCFWEEFADCAFAVNSASASAVAVSRLQAPKNPAARMGRDIGMHLRRFMEFSFGFKDGKI